MEKFNVQCFFHIIDLIFDFLERVVNPGRRFTPSEEQESLYSTDVKLTIKTIKKSDFGNYTCHARNSFGMVKGVIALKGI